MTGSKVSGRYAQSFLTAVNEKKIIGKVSKDAELVANAISSSTELKRLLQSPVVKKEKKQDILEKIFKSKVNQDTMDFIRFVAEKGREELLLLIMTDFLRLVDEQMGLASVDVTSAFELNRDQKETLNNKLENILKKKIKFKFYIDKTLLGGFIAKAGDTVYDASVKHQLELLRQQFLKSSS